MELLKIVNSLNENDKKEFLDFVFNKVHTNKDYEKDFEGEAGTISVLKEIDQNELDGTTEFYINIVFYDENNEIIAEFNDITDLQEILSKLKGGKDD